MATPIRPSRDFLVRQATLTAFEEMYPATIRLQGRPHAGVRLCRLIENDFGEGYLFQAEVRRIYRSLAQRYRVAA
jgi:hypothetical protein